jgi:hypothetical protein
MIHLEDHEIVRQDLITKLGKGSNSKHNNSRMENKIIKLKEIFLTSKKTIFKIFQKYRVIVIIIITTIIITIMAIKILIIQKENQLPLIQMNLFHKTKFK